MIGIVGKLKLKYNISGEDVEDIIDLMTVKDFRLSRVPRIKFEIEEVDYIEDTVYGVILSMIEPHLAEFIIEGGDTVEFEVQEMNLKGNMILTFFD